MLDAGVLRRLAGLPKLQGPLALALALALPCACKPEVSTTPLGVGPLALAEERAAPAPVAPSSKPAPRKLAKARREAPAQADGDEKAGDAEPDAKAKADDPEAKGATAPAKAPAFKGNYAGTDVAIFRLEGLPDREQKDEHAKIRIERDGTDAIVIVIINSDNGQDMCELPASIAGNVATLTSDEPCFTSEDDDSVSAVITGGTATLTDGHLTIHAEGTLAITANDQTLNGEVEYSFEGTRQ